MLAAGRSARLSVDGELLGWLGEVGDAGLAQFGLRTPATIAELRMATRHRTARLIPQYVRPPSFPAIEREINLVMPETVLWADLAATARDAAGEYLESLQYVETYRNAEDAQLGPNRKSVVLRFTLRRADGTLTGAAADAAQSRILDAAAHRHGAELRS
jgi:phenylalanyl-tRNA synthetase beta chain